MQTSKTSYKIIYTIIINAFGTHTSYTQKTHTPNTFIHTSEQNAHQRQKSVQSSILHLNNIWN